MSRYRNKVYLFLSILNSANENQDPYRHDAVETIRLQLSVGSVDCPEVRMYLSLLAQRKTICITQIVEMYVGFAVTLSTIGVFIFMIIHFWTLFGIYFVHPIPKYCYAKDAMCYMYSLPSYVVVLVISIITYLFQVYGYV